MKIYLAARYGRQLEMLEIAARLEDAGHEVTSRWIRGAHEADDGTADPGLRAQLAWEDLADIDAAQAFVAFTEQPGLGVQPWWAARRGGLRAGEGQVLGAGWSARERLLQPATLARPAGRRRADRVGGVWRTVRRRLTHRAAGPGAPAGATRPAAGAVPHPPAPLARPKALATRAQSGAAD